MSPAFSMSPWKETTNHTGISSVISKQTTKKSATTVKLTSNEVSWSHINGAVECPLKWSAGRAASHHNQLVTARTSSFPQRGERYAEGMKPRRLSVLELLILSPHLPIQGRFIFFPSSIAGIAHLRIQRDSATDDHPLRGRSLGMSGRVQPVHDNGPGPEGLGLPTSGPLHILSTCRRGIRRCLGKKGPLGCRSPSCYAWFDSMNRGTCLK